MLANGSADAAGAAGAGAAGAAPNKLRAKGSLEAAGAGAAAAAAAGGACCCYCRWYCRFNPKHTNVRTHENHAQTNTIPSCKARRPPPERPRRADTSNITTARRSPAPRARRAHTSTPAALSRITSRAASSRCASESDASGLRARARAATQVTTHTHTHTEYRHVQAATWRRAPARSQQPAHRSARSEFSIASRDATITTPMHVRHARGRGVARQ